MLLEHCINIIMVREIERRRIFESDSDREDSLDRLRKIVKEGRTRPHSPCQG